MDVEIVIDAITDHAVHIEIRRITGVDLFAVHHELRFPAMDLNTELVHRPAALVRLGDGVARGPFDDRGRPRGVARAPANRVHPVDRTHQEIGVGLAGIGEVLAADEDAEGFRVCGIDGMYSIRRRASYTT